MLRRGLRTVAGDMLHLGAVRKESQRWGLRNRELCRMWRPYQVTTKSGKQRDTGIGREGDLEAAGGKHPHFLVKL